MRVRVKLFAVVRELVGRDELEIKIPEIATITDVRCALAVAAPELNRVLPHALLAVDAKYAGDSTVITQESELALIPPVSGG